MQTNVSGLLKSSIGATRNYRVSDTVNISGSDSLVQGDVSLVRTNRGILVKATLNTGVEVSCGRCLNQFRAPLTLEIEEEYFPAINIDSGTPQSPPDEPGCFTINGRHILDLTEAVRQYALLAIPMKLLCREDCAGLCPTCGHDLNEGPCQCLSQETGHR
ncbi:MAG: DUF177 domain-containing protein [Dehalococcoidales bacterium]|nr:DUF177 domain-containing protein [Dehalococcoidales bacterium]